MGNPSRLQTSKTRRPHRLRQLHRGPVAHRHVRGVLGEQQRIFRLHQHLRGLGDHRLLRRDARRHLDRGRGRDRHVVYKRAFLQRRVVAHVDGALGLAHHDGVGAREGVRHAVDAAGLVVPLGEVPHRVALGEGRVDPVDERAPVLLVHGAGGADDEDRAAVDVGVVDAHGRMQQPHHVVHDGDHGLARRLGVAVGDLHRDLLVVAQQHLGIVLAVVHHGVVETPVAGPRIEGDVGDVVELHEVDDDVRLPALFRFLDVRHGEPFSNLGSTIQDS